MRTALSGRQFDSPAGPLGNQFRLNNRKQLPNESLSDFVDALKLIAQGSTWNPEEQQLKIIETTLENANEPIIKNKLLKLLSQAQDEHWNIGRKWNRFNEKIKNLDKFKALEQYSKIDNPEISKDSQAIFQLSQQVQALMALQKSNKPNDQVNARRVDTSRDDSLNNNNQHKPDQFAQKQNQPSQSNFQNRNWNNGSTGYSNNQMQPFRNRYFQNNWYSNRSYFRPSAPFNNQRFNSYQRSNFGPNFQFRNNFRSNNNQNFRFPQRQYYQPSRDYQRFPNSKNANGGAGQIGPSSAQ